MRALLEAMPVVALRAELRARRLPVVGSKPALVDRLQAAIARDEQAQQVAQEWRAPDPVARGGELHLPRLLEAQSDGCAGDLMPDAVILVPGGAAGLPAAGEGDVASACGRGRKRSCVERRGPAYDWDDRWDDEVLAHAEGDWRHGEPGHQFTDPGHAVWAGCAPLDDDGYAAARQREEAALRRAAAGMAILDRHWERVDAERLRASTPELLARYDSLLQGSSLRASTPELLARYGSLLQGSAVAAALPWLLRRLGARPLAPSAAVATELLPPPDETPLSLLKRGDVAATAAGAKRATVEAGGGAGASSSTKRRRRSRAAAAAARRAASSSMAAGTSSR